MSYSWFRMYAEFASDPKVQRLSEADQRRYIMLLCLRCSNVDVTLHGNRGVTLLDEDVTFQLRISDAEWIATKAQLISKKLIDEHNCPTAWEKRQYRTDSSAERVAKHRALKKKASNGSVTLQKQKSNVVVTPPDTDTDTEADTDFKTITKSCSFEPDVGCVKKIDTKDGGGACAPVASPGQINSAGQGKVRGENLRRGRSLPLVAVAEEEVFVDTTGDLFDGMLDAQPASAKRGFVESPPDADTPPAGESQYKKRKRMADESRPTRDAYRAAYEARHGVEPIFDAMANTTIRRAVETLGQDIAPQVVAYYLKSNDPSAVKTLHSLGVFRQQMNRFYVEWKRSKEGLVAKNLPTTQSELKDAFAGMRGNFRAKDYRSGVDENGNLVD